MDELLITGEDNAEHFNNLKVVLDRLSEAGVRMRKSKCLFLEDKVGHRLKQARIHIMDDKVQPIQNVSKSTNVKRLRSYFGLQKF